MVCVRRIAASNREKFLIMPTATTRETKMSRYREISPAEMTPAQKQVHDEIVAGKRGRFGGPFQILIRAPEVCRHLQRLGEYLRWGSSLPPALSELAICLTGFFPGLLLYFTYWFPTYHHARIVSGFLVGLPIAVAGGAPISTALLGLDGLFGLRGWQIMYIAEGVPTVLIGIVTLFVLTDRPAQAKFLTVEEKTWLSAKLDSERKAKEAVRTFSMLQGMFDLKVLLLALNYFG